ncbi:phospholipid phosphatase 3-like [Entelurus aequoreus]|uniref:phospholipid phosphatase 3-like n=1 Tax=Entelurus aequoreus TaxID=161455 RepID=UPI002B1D12FF|nr:phospholipid phosphatase 3-like [Entelurus aequoreus]
MTKSLPVLFFTPTSLVMLDQSGGGPHRGRVSAEIRPKATKSRAVRPEAPVMERSTRKKVIEIGGFTLSTRKFLVALDILCLVLASIPFFISELKAVGPYKRGFICGDLSIAYPYLRSETIPDEVLIAAGILITGVTIALGECYRLRYLGVTSKAFVKNKYVSCLYKELGCFLFGCCVGQSLTNIAKLSVGRLRPHFLSVCGVTYASLQCTDGTYIEPLCTKTDRRLIEEARKSFFSGHASFAMYTMLYLAFYLQARLTWKGARLIKPVLQFFLFLLAFYTGLTRVSDNKHHPSDVVVGYILGALTAYWVAYYISSMFKKPSWDKDAVETQDKPLSAHHSIC